MKTRLKKQPDRQKKKPASGKNPHWVHLISQERYDSVEISGKIMHIIERENMDIRGKSIFLKVSFVFPVRDPERVKMIITNPHFIAGVSLALLESGARVIYIGDGETFGSARYAFDIVGLPEAIRRLPDAARKKIKFCYLDEALKDWTVPERPFCPEVRLDFPRIVRDADIFISLPKLKVNIFADVTLSVKNGMGMICKKTRLAYHNKNLHSLIADIFQVRPPDYVITDAVFAGEAQGPMEATPYPTNLIIFGNNGPAVDTVCCALMGYDPMKIKHLAMLGRAGYGPTDIAGIRIEEKDLLKKRKHRFIRPDMNLKKLSPKIICHMGECCESGCQPFIRAILDGYGINKGWSFLDGLTVIAGKEMELPQEILKKLKKRRTLVYGKCVERYKKYGVYYKGCPPDYIKALMTLPVRTSMGFSPWIGYLEYWTYAKTSILHFFSVVTGKKYKSAR